MPELSRAETEHRIAKILIRNLGVSEDDLQPDTRLVPLGDEFGAKVATDRPDLGADSLDVVELVMTIEDEFNLEIPDDEAELLNTATVGQLVDFVHAKLGQRP